MVALNSMDLQVLCDIARRAGQEIMAVYMRDFSVWHKSDDSPLTEADLRADSIIREGLEAAFPQVFILSEESSSVATAFGEVFFLVDPLDGTKEFLKRSNEFTVNIALVNQGHVVAGVVYAPAQDDLYFAARGRGAFRSCAGATEKLNVANFNHDRPVRVVGSRSHGVDVLATWLARLPHAHDFVAAGSSLKFCKVASAQADIYPRFGSTSQWDTAAAQCVLEAAGGYVLDLSGRPLHYGLGRPILNAHFVAIGDPSLRALLPAQQV